MGHYQDFSMADILERVEFKRVGGERKRRQLRGKFQFPYHSPAPLAQPNPGETGKEDWQSSPPISRSLGLISANQREPGNRRLQRGRVTQRSVKTRLRNAAGDKLSQELASAAL